MTKRPIPQPSSFQSTEGCSAAAGQTRDEERQLNELSSEASLRAIGSLETVDPTPSTVEARVRLALDTVKGLGGMENPQLGLRALKAAVRRGEEIEDPFLRRKWMLFLGVMEIGAGRAGEAMKHLVDSLELAREIGDRVGVIAAWANVALLASKAGQYEDSISFSSRAIDLIEEEELRSGVPQGHQLAGPLLNRGNALRRLGRVEAAVTDLACSVSLSLGEQSNLLGAIRIAKGLALLAGCHYERGELARGNVYLEALKTRSSEEELPARVRRFADLASAEGLGAAGRWDKSIEDLEDLLAQCGNEHFDFKEDVLYALYRIALAAGRDAKAEDYVRRLADGMRSNAEVVVRNFSRLPNADKDVGTALQEVDRLVGGLTRCQTSVRESGSAWENLVAMAASAVMLEDKSGEHGIRVAALSGHIGMRMGLSSDSVRLVEEAGLLHDLGKVATPSSLLTKRDPLSDSEAEILLRHADDGGRLIEHSCLANRGQVAEVVRLHHQPFDGIGATAKISGDEIPLEARIVAACDRFDALVSGRPRSPPVDIAEALREILRLAGRDLDPRVAAVLIEEVRGFSRSHVDLLAFLSEKAASYGYTSARRRLLGASV